MKFGCPEPSKKCLTFETFEANLLVCVFAQMYTMCPRPMPNRVKRDHQSYMYVDRNAVLKKFNFPHWSKVPGASEAVPAEKGTGGEEVAAGPGGPGGPGGAGGPGEED